MRHATLEREAEVRSKRIVVACQHPEIATGSGAQ
jgi:hypothetical protein